MMYTFNTYYRNVNQDRYCTQNNKTFDCVCLVCPVSYHKCPNVQIFNYLATCASENSFSCLTSRVMRAITSLATKSLLELESGSLVIGRALGRQTLVGSLLEPGVRTDARVGTEKYEHQGTRPVDRGMRLTWRCRNRQRFGTRIEHSPEYTGGLG